MAGSTFDADIDSSFMEAVMDNKIEEVVDRKYPSTPTWSEIFCKSELRQKVNLEIFYVQTTGWAMGRTDKEVLDQAVDNLKARDLL